jgi:hypothetical protein
MGGITGTGVIGLGVVVVVSATTAGPVEPPPQPTSVNKLNSHVAIANRANGMQIGDLKFSMEKLFSRCWLYFIVASMNAIEHTLKYSAAQSGFFSAFQWRVALAGMLLALIVPMTAHAEWQKVTTTDSGIIYVDDGTIKRNGPIRSFWSLLDYRTPQKAQRGAYFVSTRTHMEMDCRKEMVHILQFSMHSGPMLTGEIVDSQGVMREWQTIPPDTPLVSLFKFVCGK